MRSHLRSSLPVPLLLLLLLLLAAAQTSSGQLNVRQLASLLANQWEAGQRSGRALNPAQLLSSSQLIVTPKLEITSPTLPKDGGSFQLYADFPISLGGLGDSFFAATDRNDTVTGAASLAAVVPLPPSAVASPAPPPSADAAPPAPPSPPSPPPADDSAPLRKPTIILSYGRRGGRAGGDDGDAPLKASSGFHDVALQMLLKLGMDGRVCLLRAVCELSARPLSSNGLLGDLLNTVAEIPSTNNRTLEEELKVARQLGLRGAPCTAVFDDCDNIIINKLAK